MNTRYVQVDREAFCKALENSGFLVDSMARGELVYFRQHHIDPTMFIKIYTSLPLSGGNGRERGADAIRVLLTFDNPRTGANGCLLKTPRVYRTGSQEAVIERTLERARDAYREANRRAARFRK